MPLTDSDIPVEQVESQFLDYLKSNETLRESLITIPSRIYDFGEGILQTLAGNIQRKVATNSRIATLQLLTIMLQEYRSCILLARVGYPSGTAAISATIYEAFYVLTALTIDDDKAKRWLEFAWGEEFGTDTLKSFPLEFRYAKCREDFYLRLYPKNTKHRQLQEQGSIEVYAHLSGYKHVNPASRNKINGHIVPYEGEHFLLFTARPFITPHCLAPIAFSMFWASDKILSACVEVVKEFNYLYDVQKFFQAATLERERLRQANEAVKGYIQKMQ